MLYDEVESTLISNFLTVARSDGGGQPYVPEWERMGWKTDAVDSGVNQRALLRHLQRETDGAADCTYEYCIKVEESGGDAELINMLCKWFTTEDLIFYGIRYDSDGTHRLSYWNPTQEKRFKGRAGKFYRQFFGRDERYAQWFAQEWDQCAQNSKNTHQEYTVTLHTDPEDIADQYIAMQGSECDSCCTHRPNHFDTGGIHPCRVYGGDSGVSLAVVRRKENPENITGRTLLYKGKYVRIYPPGDTARAHLVENVLRAEGIAYEKISLNGARLNYVPHPEQPNLVICPYIDCEVRPHSVCVDVQEIDGKKYLVVSNMGFDTHQSDFYSTASFDWVTMERARDEPEHDAECDECGDGFYSDDEGCVMLDYNSYCTERCAGRGGWIYAFVSPDNSEWVSEDETLEYDGEYYHNEALDQFGLVMVEDGDIYPVSQCYRIADVGWHPMSDVKVCHTLADFRRGSEQKRVTVWCPVAMSTGNPLTPQDLEEHGYELFDLSDRVQFLAFQKECKVEMLDVVQHQLTTSQQPF